MINMAYNETLKTQYQIMTPDNLNQHGQYVPDFETLIQEAPNETMAEKWRECEARLKEWEKHDPRFSGFTFNSVYMMKMKCGDYEIFQHSTTGEEDLNSWMELMQSDKYYKKCTRCICG